MTPTVSTTTSVYGDGLNLLAYRGERHLSLTFNRFAPGQKCLDYSRHVENLTLDQARALLELLVPQVAALEADLAPRVMA